MIFQRYTTKMSLTIPVFFSLLTELFDSRMYQLSQIISLDTVFNSVFLSNLKLLYDRRCLKMLCLLPKAHNLS